MLLSPVLSRCLECTPLRLLLLGGLLPPFLRRLLLGGLLGFIGLLPLAAFAPVYAAQTGLEWQTVTTSLDHIWKSVAYDNGLFVAVAYSGVGNQIMTAMPTVDTLPARLLVAAATIGSRPARWLRQAEESC